MIAFLSGTIITKKPTHIVLDVNGVGYQVFISLTTHARIGNVGDPAKLLTRQYIRDDSMQLFGFAGERERDFFSLLITVSGIGPRLALIILSGMEPNELQRALAIEDQAALTRISGIGKKTAMRMIVELKDKMEKFGLDPDSDVPMPATAASTTDEAVQALIALGFKTNTAQTTVSKVQRKLGAEASVESIIRHALKGE